MTVSREAGTVFIAVARNLAIASDSAKMREVFVGQFGSRVTGHWVGFQVWKKVKNYKGWPYDLIASLIGKSNDAVHLNVYAIAHPQSSLGFDRTARS